MPKSVDMEENMPINANPDNNVTQSHPSFYLRSESFPGRNFRENLFKVSSMFNQSFHSVPADKERTNSTFVAGWNVSNLIQGIGILGIPYAFRMGGWLAVGFNFLFAAMCCFTGKLLIDCLYEECQLTKRRIRVLDNYSAVGKKVWPRFGSQIVTIISITEMFGGLTLYIILMSQMSSVLMHEATPYLTLYHWSVITAFAAMPLLFVKDMSIVSIFSVVGVLGLMLTIVTIIIYSFSNLSQMSLENMPPISGNRAPVCLGIIIFSYCAHAVFPTIEGSMKHPESYPKMMTSTFILAAILKAVMGISAVLIFGIHTEQEITANMKVNFYFSTLVSLFVFLNVFFSVPLVAYVILERMDTILYPHFDPCFRPGERYSLVWKFLTRSILICSSLLIFMLVPQFALLMSLVGSFTGTCLSFVFPCWFHVVLKRYRLTKFDICVRYAVSFVAIVIGITGAIFSLKEIMSTFKSLY